MKIQLRSLALLFLVSFLFSKAQAAEWLVKLSDRVHPSQVQQYLSKSGMSVMSVEDLRFNSWYLVRTATESLTRQEGMAVGKLPGTRWVEPNKRIRPYGNRNFQTTPRSEMAPRDPAFKRIATGKGPDPLIGKQWMITDTGLDRVPPQIRGDKRVIVAVIDTGVDYNHPDLNGNIWMNPGEAGALANNGIDDDKNGYVDDFMGWDFADNDNLPWDRTSTFGNPGHGTHCSGVIAAQADNGVGIRGIAPNVTIMPLRFITEKGEGSTADAVKAMKYAIEMGAWITSNSWGGPEEAGDPDSQILREVFAEAATRGRLTVVAAGNERTDVDRNPMQATPASYNLPNMLTVAASTPRGDLAGFSNYGAKLVHLAAPGTGILSTVTGDRYMNLDGTSMATPVVAGAAALFWSMNPQMKVDKVRHAILSSVTQVPSLRGAVLTGGKLNIEALMQQSTERVRR